MRQPMKPMGTIESTGETSAKAPTPEWLRDAEPTHPGRDEAPKPGQRLQNGALVLLTEQVAPHLDIVLCLSEAGELVTWNYNRQTCGAGSGRYFASDCKAAANDWLRRSTFADLERPD